MTQNDENKQNPKTTAQVKAEAREKRLKQQLRENLHRRKAQARLKDTQE